MLLAVAIFRDFPDAEQVVLVAVRLLTAALLGGIVGFERELEGKSAGMRTHMLVALGAAAFTLIPVVAGVDGAGIILPIREELKVRGLTTAANIWVTAAAGVAVGAGYLWSGVLTVGLAWI